MTSWINPRTLVLRGDSIHIFVWVGPMSTHVAPCRSRAVRLLPTSSPPLPPPPPNAPSPAPPSASLPPPPQPDLTSPVSSYYLVSYCSIDYIEKAKLTVSHLTRTPRYAPRFSVDPY